jgi:hypothetical protein
VTPRCFHSEFVRTALVKPTRSSHLPQLRSAARTAPTIVSTFTIAPFHGPTFRIDALKERPRSAGGLRRELARKAAEPDRRPIRDHLGFWQSLDDSYVRVRAKG